MPNDNDSSLANLDKISVAAISEYGMTGWVDPAKLAHVLKLPQEDITAWLVANAAEAGTHPKSQKVLRSLGGEVPLRISEVPYIRHEHHELQPSVFSRPAIGSLANCSACHSEAEQGVFDEDGVRIPK